MDLVLNWAADICKGADLTEGGERCFLAKGLRLRAQESLSCDGVVTAAGGLKGRFTTAEIRQFSLLGTPFHRAT